MAEAAGLIPAAHLTEFDVARENDRAAREGIRSTPTVIVRTDVGAEVFRAEGVPSLTQVLKAAAKAV